MIRETLLSVAKLRLKKFASSSEEKVRKTIERFEKQAAKERDKVIRKVDDEVLQWHRERAASDAKKYEDRAKQQIPPVIEVNPSEPAKKEEPYYGNPFVNDS